MKCATFPTPPSTGLNGIQFSIPNVLESLIPMDEEVKNKDKLTEVIEVSLKERYVKKQNLSEEKT